MNWSRGVPAVAGHPKALDQIVSWDSNHWTFSDSIAPTTLLPLCSGG